MNRRPSHSLIDGPLKLDQPYKQSTLRSCPLGKQTMRSILLSLCFSALSFLHAANADDIQARGESWEDPTCKDVARAIIMTEIYPSYSYEMPLVREDGTYRPFIERKFSPTERQEKRHFAKEWRSTPRLGVEWSSWDRYEPTLTNCKLISSEVEAIGEVTHYRMNWTSLPYRAEMDAWISKDHQMLTRVTRRYLGGELEFPEERVALLFKYDGLLVTSPLRSPEPSESRTSCERVKRMTAKFNETQAVQMTMRFVNNGLRGAISRALLTRWRQGIFTRLRVAVGSPKSWIRHYREN